MGCARGAVQAKDQEECTLPQPRELIIVENPTSNEEHRLYDLPDQPWLWSRAKSSERDAYAAEVTSKLGNYPEPHALIERQMRVFEGKSEAKNSELVLSRKAGVIEPAFCLQTLLWVEQARRFPMLAHPTEMGAFILRKPGRLRIYFSSMDRNGQKIRSEVTSRVADDLAAGFVLAAHLHNHPFMFDRAVGDRLYTTEQTLNDIGGGLAPSLPDVQFFRSAANEYQLKEAWITNGIHSLRIQSDQLGAFFAE
jgi:hypothetical protein